MTGSVFLEVIPQIRTYTRYGIVERCNVQLCGISFIILEIPYRQAHKARSCACSLCLTE